MSQKQSVVGGSPKNSPTSSSGQSRRLSRSVKNGTRDTNAPVADHNDPHHKTNVFDVDISNGEIDFKTIRNNTTVKSINEPLFKKRGKVDRFFSDQQRSLLPGKGGFGRSCSRGKPKYRVTATKAFRRVYVPVEGDEADDRNLYQKLVSDYSGEFLAGALADGFLFRLRGSGVIDHTSMKDLHYNDIVETFGKTHGKVPLLKMSSLWNLNNWKLPIVNQIVISGKAFVLVEKYRNNFMYTYTKRISCVHKTRKNDGVTKVLPHPAIFDQPIEVLNHTYEFKPIYENARFYVYSLVKVVLGKNSREVKIHKLPNKSTYWKLNKWTVFFSEGVRDKYIDNDLLNMVESKVVFDKVVPSLLSKIRYYLCKYSNDLKLKLTKQDMLDITAIILNKSADTKQLQAILYQNDEMFDLFNSSLELKRATHIPLKVKNILKQVGNYVSESYGDKYPSITEINKRIQSCLDTDINHSRLIGILSDTALYIKDSDFAKIAIPSAMSWVLKIVKDAKLDLHNKKITLDTYYIRTKSNILLYLEHLMNKSGKTLDEGSKVAEKLKVFWQNFSITKENRAHLFEFDEDLPEGASLLADYQDF